MGSYGNVVVRTYIYISKVHTQWVYWVHDGYIMRI